MSTPCAAGSEPARMLEGLAVIRDAFPRTVRLVSSARLRAPVLAALVAPDEVDALAEIEGATSARLMAQERGAEGVGRRGIRATASPMRPSSTPPSPIAKPREPNRFNATRGAWYAALAVETAMREVAFHMADFLAKSGELKGVVEYAELFASMAGEFVDLRATPAHPCLNPDPAIGYPAGNAIADAARAQGLNGVVYPSVRHAGGTCIVAFGRMRCSRSRRARSSGSNGPAGRSRRSHGSRNSLVLRGVDFRARSDRRAVVGSRRPALRPRRLGRGDLPPRRKSGRRHAVQGRAHPAVERLGVELRVDRHRRSGRGCGHWTSVAGTPRRATTLRNAASNRSRSPSAANTSLT